MFDSLPNWVWIALLIGVGVLFLLGLKNRIKNASTYLDKKEWAAMSKGRRGLVYGILLTLFLFIYFKDYSGAPDNQRLWSFLGVIVILVLVENLLRRR